MELNRYINLKLASLGQPTAGSLSETRFLETAGPLLCGRRRTQMDARDSV